MNKTITINIAGLSFHIDEDAYNKLDAYINAVRNSIQQEDNREEIIADIEGRIAELFAERVDPQTGVIRMTNVDEIINIMGKPEDYIIEDDNNSSHTTYTAKQTKKIYRDGEKRVFGGVCSGIGHYLNVDAVWIRIIFIILFFMYGVSILVYFILWIIIPKATTVADVLEMKGEPVNISNIEKQFREGLSSSYKALKTNGKTAGDVIRKVIGIILVVSGAIGTFSSFFVPVFFNSQRQYIYDHITNFNEVVIGLPFWILNLSLFLVASIPFILMTLVGIKLLNTKIKYIGIVSIVMGVLWLIALFTFAYGMVNTDTQYAKLRTVFEENFDKNVYINDLMLTENDTLNLMIEKDYRIVTVNDTISSGYRFSEINNVDVEILESNKGRSYVEVEEKMFNQSAHYFKNQIDVLGFNKVVIRDIKYSKTLAYHYAISQDTLVLSNAILATKNEYTRDNEVNVRVFITPNQTIKINSRDDDYIEDVDLMPGTHYYQFQNGRLRLSATNDTIVNNL